MTEEQELKVTEQIRTEMTRVRNDAIATGMRSALAVVYDMCIEDISDEKKIKLIKDFCEKGLKTK